MSELSYCQPFLISSQYCLEKSEEGEMTREEHNLIQRKASKTRQAAKRVGIEIESPQPTLPVTEQEETDTM
jgi:hypothetical protein